MYDFLGQAEVLQCPVPCSFWQKEIHEPSRYSPPGTVIDCQCVPDPLKIGGAAVVVGAVIWYLMR